MVNLFAGISIPLNIEKDQDAELVILRRLHLPNLGWQPSLESMATFAWNQWQPCRGIGGNLRVESVATFVWNMHETLITIDNGFILYGVVAAKLSWTFSKGLRSARAPGRKSRLTKTNLLIHRESKKVYFSRTGFSMAISDQRSGSRSVSNDRNATVL